MQQGMQNVRGKPTLTFFAVAPPTIPTGIDQGLTNSPSEGSGIVAIFADKSLESASLSGDKLCIVDSRYARDLVGDRCARY